MSSREDRANKPEEWVRSVFGHIGAELPAGFSGLGLVLYAPPLDLPVTPLVPLNQIPRLPAGGPGESAELLRRLSDSAAPMHDGFHLVDAKSLTITRVCHFFAPPIPAEIPKGMPNHPVGARYMAALLGSLLPSVVITAVLSREGAIIFERGVARKLNVVSGSSNV
jgi:hypothetical protein